MELSYELYWSFSSPYSYIATRRLVALERDYGVKAIVRPVHPVAIRKPELLKTRDSGWFRYFMLDAKREAEFHGLPFRQPQPFPLVVDVDSMTVSEHQPYIYRLTALGVAASEQGLGLPFLDEMSRLIFGGEVEDWTAEGEIERAIERAGLDPTKVLSMVEQDPERLSEVVADNHRAQQASGHHGVPLMIFEGEPFFGQDRIEQLKWRLSQRGLQARQV